MNREAIFYYLTPSRIRWFIGCTILVTAIGGSAWWFAADGIPVLWGPSASAADMVAGQELFEHEWTANDPLASGDGLGPVFNAKSCVACHFQGGTGGGGDRMHNVLQFDALPDLSGRQFISGTIHSGSLRPADRESVKVARSVYPIITFPQPPPPPPGHCGYTPPPKPPFDPLHTESVQTPALFGIGWLDRIPSKAIEANARRRGLSVGLHEVVGQFNEIPVGRVPYTRDGRVGKFGWKGQFATLKEFVSAACANELGLGTPDTPQAKPLHQPKTADVPPDLNSKQFRQLVAYIDTLPKPIEVTSDQALRGKEVFKSIGCATCHTPNMGGVNGVYSDFLLYTLDDNIQQSGEYRGREIPAEIVRPTDIPALSEWKTPPLWGVADSAPYFHDGRAATLHEAILQHNGEGKLVKAAYQAASEDDRKALLAFLGSLKAPDQPAKSTTVASIR